MELLKQLSRNIKISKYFKIHTVNPQKRVTDQACDVLRKNGIVLCPTDTGYAFVCRIGSSSAIEKVRKIRNLDDDHKFSVIVSSFSEISKYARVSNWSFRIIKKAFPGPYTFILSTLPEVPRKLLPKRKTVGFRMPDSNVCREIIDQLGEPLVASSALLGNSEDAITEPEIIKPQLSKTVDLVLDAGFIAHLPSTIVDLTEDELNVIRQGSGDVEILG